MIEVITRVPVREALMRASNYSIFAIDGESVCRVWP